MTRYDSSSNTTDSKAADRVIDIWHGPDQIFGQRGQPQRWINILGRVAESEKIRSLTYSLNGAAPLPLSIGPTAHRLASAGDFNIEIDYNELSPDANTVDITATDKDNRRFTESVSVRCAKDLAFPLPYLIDWTAISSIQEAAQVVDGRWMIEGDSVRPLETGYDRLLAIGDLSWTNYEITVPVTINGFDSRGFKYPSGGPGVGIIVRWQGHYDWSQNQPSHGRWPVSAFRKWRAKNDPRINQPRRGWWPMGAIGWYKWKRKTGYRLNITGNRRALLAEDASGRKLEQGVCYVFKMRVKARPRQTALYSLKVWEIEKPEPEAWSLTGSGVEGELNAGSIALVAHHTDARFGNAHIIPV